MHPKIKEYLFHHSNIYFAMPLASLLKLGDCNWPNSPELYNWHFLSHVCCKGGKEGGRMQRILDSVYPQLLLGVASNLWEWPSLYLHCFELKLLILEEMKCWHTFAIFWILRANFPLFLHMGKWRTTIPKQRNFESILHECK